MLVVVGICTFMLVVAFLPYSAIPYRAVETENQFIQEYGTAYTSLNTLNMRPQLFSIHDDIYGVPIDDSRFTVMADLVYHDNGVDSFRFDFYKPVGNGPFPVIIAIHGGGFVMGDKAAGNMPQFNRYFASKGYAVFDIQYGLYNINEVAAMMGSIGAALSMMAPLITPNYNQSYTIEQMIENIGRFTQHLESKNITYNIDMNNIFILGRSAGGCLASIATLAYKNPMFAGNFSTTMNIKAGIWIYPITDPRVLRSPFFDTLLAGSLSLDDQYNKYSAAYLLGNSTVVPPIMIVHGDKDNWVNYYQQGLAFDHLASSLGKKCILCTIPGAGHAFDLVFQSYGGQISTYYIERFIALNS